MKGYQERLEMIEKRVGEKIDVELRMEEHKILVLIGKYDFVYQFRVDKRKRIIIQRVSVRSDERIFTLPRRISFAADSVARITLENLVKHKENPNQLSLF